MTSSASRDARTAVAKVIAEFCFLHKHVILGII